MTKALTNGEKTPAAAAFPLPLEDGSTESQGSERSAVPTPPRELPAEASLENHFVGGRFRRNVVKEM